MVVFELLSSTSGSCSSGLSEGEHCTHSQNLGLLIISLLIKATIIPASTGSKRLIGITYVTEKSALVGVCVCVGIPPKVPPA